MASEIKLKNSQGKTLTIRNSDSNSSDILLDPMSNAYVVDTIEDLGTVPESIEVVIVKDVDRGGTFVHKTEVEIDPNTGELYEANGGTVFAGNSGFWVRQYSGAVNVKWFGAKGDWNGIAGTDDRFTIQAAIQSCNHVVIDKQYFMSLPADGGFNRCLTTKSNSTIDFIGDGKLSLMPHSSASYSMLYVTGTNVKINNPKLDGRKDSNSATTGEFGMGIYIGENSLDVTIKQPITNNMWGDGIYIAGPNTIEATPKNITIINHKADGCRRQGLSIVGGNIVNIINPIWENISGTAPASGIDIEPNATTALLNNIFVRNPITKSCSVGVNVYLSAYLNAKRTINISIDGHNDTQSATTCQMTIGDTHDESSGIISYTNIHGNKNFGAGLVIREKAQSKVAVVCDNIIINENNQSLSSSSERVGLLIANTPATKITKNIKVTNLAVINTTSGHNYNSSLNATCDNTVQIDYPISDSSTFMLNYSYPDIYIKNNINRIDTTASIVATANITRAYRMIGSTTKTFTLPFTVDRKTPFNVQSTLEGETQFIVASSGKIIVNGIRYTRLESKVNTDTIVELEGVKDGVYRVTKIIGEYVLVV